MNSTAIVASLETLHKWNQTPNDNISSTPTIIVSQINQHGKPIELSSTTELIIIPNICHYFPIHPTNMPDSLISITFLISNSLDKCMKYFKYNSRMPLPLMIITTSPCLYLILCLLFGRTYLIQIVACTLPTKVSKRNQQNNSARKKTTMT